MKRLDDVEYISTAEAKAKLSEKINMTTRGRKFVIMSHGKPRVAMIDYNEYLNLKEGSEYQPRVIDIEDWKKESSARKKVADSISKLFDSKLLTRKGQKRYKNEAVRRMEKNKK